MDQRQRQDTCLSAPVVFEVGTGRSVSLPVGLWLLGAKQIYTYDVNPYLREELVLADIEEMRNAPARVLSILGDSPTRRQRLKILLDAASDLDNVLEVASIEYLCPGDARRSGLPDQSVDLHVSRSVFEHVPEADLLAIAREASRLLTEEGLAIHCVDFSDHFSHNDSSISSVNFLQFSDEQWARIAGNRFMNHNRLRSDDMVDLMSKAGLRVVNLHATIDQRALTALRDGFTLDQRFVRKDAVTNATRSAWIVARKSADVSRRDSGRNQ